MISPPRAIHGARGALRTTQSSPDSGCPGCFCAVWICAERSGREEIGAEGIAVSSQSGEGGPSVPVQEGGCFGISPPGKVGWRGDAVDEEKQSEGLRSPMFGEEKVRFLAVP